MACYCILAVSVTYLVAHIYARRLSVLSSERVCVTGCYSFSTCLVRLLGRVLMGRDRRNSARRADYANMPADKKADSLARRNARRRLLYATKKHKGIFSGRVEGVTGEVSGLPTTLPYSSCSAVLLSTTGSIFAQRMSKRQRLMQCGHTTEQERDRWSSVFCICYMPADKEADFLARRNVVG